MAGNLTGFKLGGGIAAASAGLCAICLSLTFCSGRAQLVKTGTETANPKIIRMGMFCNAVQAKKRFIDKFISRKSIRKHAHFQ